MSAMYQVGEMTDSGDFDDVIEGMEAAYAVAIEMAEEFDESIIGVWAVPEDVIASPLLMAIAHQGDLFVRVTP